MYVVKNSPSGPLYGPFETIEAASAFGSARRDSLTRDWITQEVMCCLGAFVRPQPGRSDVITAGIDGGGLVAVVGGPRAPLEYQIVAHRFFDESAGAAEKLSKYGAEGWCVINAVYVDAGHAIQYLLERPQQPRPAGKLAEYIDDRIAEAKKIDA